MQKNDTLTLTQAAKLYTGVGIAGNTLRLLIVLTIMYLIFFSGAVFGYFSSANSHGEQAEITEAIAAFSQDSTFAAFPCIVTGGAAVGFSMQIFTKSVPGAKFFRTVKGGFGSFVKFRICVPVSVLCSIALFLALSAVLALTGIVPLKYGFHYLAALFTSAVYTLAIENFILMTDEKALTAGLSFMNVFTPLTALLLCEFVSPVITAVILAAGAGLLILSFRVFFGHYRKNRWES